MFNLEDYIIQEFETSNLKINEEGIPNIEVLVNIDKEKINKDSKKLKKMLHNLHQLLNNDFIILVTNDEIRFMKVV